MSSLKDIRSGFLDFFAARGHAVVPSAPLVPDDPTLLFVNAGMVPFKNAFTGVQAPLAPRAVSAQKCVRAGGKHNDLENVGYTARHHTFFEMLGNFSFGDYFKEDAIKHAWDLVTGEFGLDRERLTVTVYHEDTEARALWRKIAGLPDHRIISIATSDNFWSMGDTGPCGPCSEIFYDHGAHIPGGPPGSPDEDGDRFVEIWNLVFMQFDQSAPGQRTRLPKPSIDTGMGLERIAAVMQGVHDNYDIDLFAALLGASHSLLGAPADREAAASHRVIADHLRASAFLMADGVSPDNEGRGYVLRRIMRRAMRHAHLLGAEEPVMHRLAPILTAQMGEAYPELVRAEAAIVEGLRQEEERFQRTLGRGLGVLEEAVKDLAPGGTLSGDVAFKLYDTFGFPLDLTQDALRARGLGVDTAGFTAAMDRQKAEARASWAGSGSAGASAVWTKLGERIPATRFIGYDAHVGAGRLLAIVHGEAEAKAGKPGETVELVFDQTPFYGESGGQVGDGGRITFKGGAGRVLDVKKRAGGALTAHIVELDGALKIGADVELHVNADARVATRANHSATHLLHAALRDVLGPHVSQKGSYVGPDRLRFDFSHGGPVTAAELAAIEDQVNAVVRQNTAAQTALMSPKAATAAGALALFGEKYGDEVRVLTLGRALKDQGAPYSVELCGGTHVSRTGDIGLFKIIGEGAVGAGVRRVEALTGAAAKAWLDEQAGLARALADALKSTPHEALARLSALLEEKRSTERALSDARRALALAGAGTDRADAEPELIGGVKLLARIAQGVGGKDLRQLVDQAKAQLGSGVAAFIGVDGGKAGLAIGVTDDLTARIDARALVRSGAEALGGSGGGGRADMAQAGGPDADQAEAALEAVRAALREAASAKA